MKRTSEKLEKEIIKAYQDGNTMKTIGLDFSLSSATVKRILDRNNITTRTTGGIYKLPTTQVVNLYQSGFSTSQIAKKFNVTPHTIIKILKEQQIERNNIYHNVKLKENYWEIIDSFDKAYFLGLLLTDGNVYHNQVKLELKHSDIDILKTFNKYTNNSNKIIETNRLNKGKFAAFSVKRKKWIIDLQKYHIISNKTFTAELTILPKNLMPHYIRGLIDGDGWINKTGTIGFCGTEKCVTQLRDFLVSTLHVSHIKVNHTDTHVWTIQWGKKDSKLIGNYIYNDKRDCFLSRKFNVWKTIHDNTEVSSSLND